MRTNFLCIAGTEITVSALTMVGKSTLDVKSIIVGMAIVFVVVIVFMIAKR
jgi:hypothetical protein